jgi:hypothetical protein
MRMRSRPRPTAVTETMVPAARDISQSHGYDSNSSVLHRSWYVSALKMLVKEEKALFHSWARELHLCNT